MKKRIYHTGINFLAAPRLYVKLKRTAKQENMSMSQLIREGIWMKLDQIDRKNNVLETNEDKSTHSSEDED